MITQTFTVINAQIVPLAADTIVDGQPAKLTFLRAVVEAAPTEIGGRTLTLVLPPEALETITEGAVISIAITAAPAAEPEA